VFARHNAEHPASSERFERFLVLTQPPRMDRNETTDKGYINQRAVLAHRADLVASLYREPAGDEVIRVTDHGDGCPAPAVDGPVGGVG
jgi:feruloyl-CoA synthase